jgi:hypothetical protein
MGKKDQEIKDLKRRINDLLAEIAFLKSPVGKAMINEQGSGFNKKVEDKIKKIGKITEADKVYEENYWRKFLSISKGRRGRRNNRVRNQALRAEYTKEKEEAKQNKTGRFKREWRSGVISKIFKRQTFQICDARGRISYEEPLKRKGKMSEDRILKICNSKDRIA